MTGWPQTRRKTPLFLIFALCATPLASARASEWTLDPAHTTIGFSVRHMMVSTVRGQFTKFSGAATADDADPTRSTLAVKIDASSIDTREEKRDAHLRSPDFLDADKFPKLSFKSKRMEAKGEHFKLVGDLTIRGKTHEVVLDGEYTGVAKSPWGTESAGFSAHTKINRKEWGLEWNQALETGGLLVGETIEIAIDVEAMRKA